MAEEKCLIQLFVTDCKTHLAIFCLILKNVKIVGLIENKDYRAKCGKTGRFRALQEEKNNDKSVICLLWHDINRPSKKPLKSVFFGT